jgi:predicted naringenin-chalcone synthase
VEAAALHDLYHHCQTRSLSLLATHPQPAILALGTALPRYSGSQEEIGRWMAESFGDRRRVQRLVRMIHSQSGIETRYSCAPAYLEPPQTSRFAPGVDPAASATTGERMAIYEREATPLGAAAAHEALTQYAAQRGQTLEAIAGTVTHLLAVSCTGLFAPGLDFTLAKALHLPPTVRRTLIGFMGCAAAFNGLRAAAEIVRGQPQARVLVVSVELCSLHNQPSDDYDLLVGASIFSDGASACLVGCPAAGDSDYFRLEEFYTAIQPDTTEEMAWNIRDHGFALRLSPRVPDHLGVAAPAALREVFGTRRPRFWAIHPGGRAIVDKLAELFQLPPEALLSTREVLRQYGNMSSATILFVLAHMRRQLRAEAANAGAGGSTRSGPLGGVAMAFGPGLVVEMSRLTYVPPLPSLAAAEQMAFAHNREPLRVEG